MITYEFETKEFSFAEGYTHLQVRDGVLKLKTAPSAGVVALIKRNGGILAVAKKRPAKKSLEKVGLQ